MIWQQELRKLIKHPMLWCLFGVFIVFNGFLLWITIGDAFGELQKTHEEISGGRIDETFYQDKLSLYDTLDMVEVKELKQELYQYYPAGSYKEFMDERYEKLNERVEEIVETGEAEGMVYPGSVYRLHNNLYAKVLRWVFLEMGLLVVFAVLFLMDYERLNGTVALTYTSHIGRKLQWVKWCIGILGGLSLGCLLLGFTLWIWFLLVPYEGFWNTSISAALMTEPRGILLYPFITFHKMTIAQYLLATVFFGMLLVVIIGMIVGAIQLFTHNSYLSLVCIVLFLMLGLCVSGYSTKTWFDIALSWNPADMWYRMGNWFMEGSLTSNFEGAEIINVAVQLGFWGIMGKWAYQKFMKKDY